MRRPPAPDLSSLARLAQHPGAELRPLLLRVHTQLYLAADRQDLSAASGFEILALGLIPLVDDDVVSEIANLVRSRADLPEAVATALAARLTIALPAPVATQLAAPQELAPPQDAAQHEPIQPHEGDLALGRSDATPLDAGALATLVDRARRNPELALALLARPDLDLLDRAALYRFGMPEERAELRSKLATLHPVSPRPARRIISTDDRSRLIELAERGALDRLLGLLDDLLHRDTPLTDGIVTEGDFELLGLALVAVGLDTDDIIRVALSLRLPLSRSVSSVFGLAETIRSTPRDVALRLAGAGQAAAPNDLSAARSAMRGSDVGRARSWASGSLREDGRRDPIVSPRADRLPGRDSSGLADRRSISTTGRDRT